MSVDGETSRVMRGVQHGACDYLLKPIRMKELQNIWQHVFRKRINEVRDIESYGGIEEIQLMRYGSHQLDDRYLLNGGDLTSEKKRKVVENKLDDKDFSDSSSLKKARVVWTVDLHQKFVKAVNQIGFDKLGPKKILDLMDVPWLTRENVASHLQKYRLYLSRLQKENELKSSLSRINQSAASPKDTARKLGFHDSINMQPDGAANGLYGTSDNKILIHSIDHKIHEADLKGIVSLPMIEPKKAPIVNIPEPRRASRSTMGLNESFGSMERGLKYAAFDSTFPMHHSWSGEYPEIQYQEHNPHLQLENGFSHLPLSAPQHHIQVNNLRPATSTNTTPINKERDKPAPDEISPSYAKNRSQQIRQVSPTGNAFNLLSVQSQSQMTNVHTADPPVSATSSMKNQGVDRISINEPESTQGNLGRGSAFAYIDEDLTTSLFQGDCHPTNLGFQNKKNLENKDPELVVEILPYLYDALMFDYECPGESVEYPVIIDQGLFIA
ncbi:unnamed protein product [Ilex paraguariensis]|uniref:Response regulatory domain-containing protein n=1 Tax=Ilex paraguariensis TaxID=185542 RepID=A0ABC8QYR1_9AQUA